MKLIVSTEWCNKCNAPVDMKKAVLDREWLSGDCCRIFLCCPVCLAEIDNKIIDEEELNRNAQAV